ncbi:MAG: NADPH:quinone reductase-like Zn-dependent oxidoreductase [Pseudohongiellaceae bacterium]|jgi:NADPH:quinone reductase-like Zn-dependent oxidoreductase
MQAVVIREHGGSEVLRIEELPEPTPRADQVRIAVRAIGLNHLDTWVRRGVPGHKFPLPMIPGCDFSGVVDQLGEAVSGIALGDRVIAAPGFSCGHCRPCLEGRDNLCRHYGIFGETTDGGCAEYALLPAANVMPLPESLDFVQGAGFALPFLTAWNMLVARCAVAPGDDVLVHAAGSGVGSAAIQIARLFGARVIATASSPEKLAKAKELGAHDVINYEQDDFVKACKELTDRRGVDIVFEHVGEATIAGSLRCLARGGRVITCGATTGPKLEIDLRHLFFKNLSVLGSTMGSRGDLRHIVELMGSGALHPVIDRVLPLTEVAAAHEAMASREQFGRIILTTGEPS